VTVRDRGPGVDESDRAHVFDRFYRSAASRTLPGSGLGLAIVRATARAHGGDVAVDGATFALDLPAAAGDGHTVRDPSEPRPTVDGSTV
jgi:two-component system sensor histidine kinase MprB